jgi:hypothetical protein
LPRHRCSQNGSGHAAGELKNDVQDSVPLGDFAEPIEGEGRRWINVSARLFTPRGIDDGDGGQSHGDAHDQTAKMRVWNQLVDR